MHLCQPQYIYGDDRMFYVLSRPKIKLRLSGIAGGTVTY